MTPEDEYGPLSAAEIQVDKARYKQWLRADGVRVKWWLPRRDPTGASAWSLSVGAASGKSARSLKAATHNWVSGIYRNIPRGVGKI